jgi:Arc/MetJ-type ribon-helix-helix transcriptional regulator
MKFEGYITNLTIHSSTRNRMWEIVQSANFRSYEELINYLLDRYLQEKNDQEHSLDEKEQVE